MSEVHYVDNAQISKRADDYNFKLPEFGESTTDPTFYEPTATRIANMRKTASGFTGLYDYDEPLKGKSPKEIEGNALNQVGDATVDVRFSKHGMTREEISQTVTEKTLTASELLKDKKKSSLEKTEKLKEEVALANAINDSLSKQIDNSSEGSTEE